MSDDGAAAMGAARRHRLNGALETVEGHGAVTLDDLERPVVFVAALIASGHGGAPFLIGDGMGSQPWHPACGSQNLVDLRRSRRHKP
jgi:hypothetical protein